MNFADSWLNFPGDHRRLCPGRGYLANLREATQRIRATQHVTHARGMTEEVNYRQLLVRLSLRRLLLREAAYVEATGGGMFSWYLGEWGQEQAFSPSVSEKTPAG